MSDYREYENGVADVLAFLAGDTATVERNIKLRGRRSGRLRQIDVLVRGRIFGMAEATMMVECKKWATRVDIKAVESFLGMVQDVGADVGLMMTTKGATAGAHERARQERGVRLEVMSLEELRAWSPPGSVTMTYRLPADRRVEAQRTLRNAGFRVAPDTGYPATGDTVVLSVLRHYGTRHPSAEAQRAEMDYCEVALREIGIEPVHVATGITVSGGTPGHRWLEVAVDGHPIGLKVLAATEDEAEEQLNSVAAELTTQFGVPRTSLSVIRPDGWPIQGIFGL